MELWDILDACGRRTGRTIQRGERLAAGEYHLVVHVWPRRADGAYLIQRRADELSWNPGMWATTGGSVIAGEESLAGAVRETREELGIDIAPDAFSLLRRLQAKEDFTDVWLANVKPDIDRDVELGREVSAVAWANKREIVEMVRAGEFVDYPYIPLLPD